MILKDKDAKRWLKICDCPALSESVESFPEEERDGKSDLQILADEVGYRLDLYTEEGNWVEEEYKEAVEFLKDFKRGKIPCWNTLPPIPKYTLAQLEVKASDAKAVVNEYKRLKSLMKRLSERGYYY